MKTFVILTRRADGAAEDFTRRAKPEYLHVWQGFADIHPNETESADA